MKNIIVLLSSIVLFSCVYKKGKTMTDKTENTIILNDMWVIQTMQGKPLLANTMKRPVLEFKSAVLKFNGNDSCNNIFGAIERLTESELKFGMIAGTKMMCPEIKVANTYLKLLAEVRYYKIKNMELMLFDIEKRQILRYKKVD